MTDQKDDINFEPFEPGEDYQGEPGENAPPAAASGNNRNFLIAAGIIGGVFLIGLIVMGMMQNAFANASSSLIQSKITGNIVFILLAPLTPGDLFAAYLLAAVVRAVMVGAGVILAVAWLVPLPLPNPLWLAAFAFTGAGILAALGIVAGIWAEKFDQLAAFQNFLVMPLTFLAGVFYSIDSLPPFWQAASHLNPFFYAIDGFRYAFFGRADVSPWTSLAIASGTFCALSWLTLRLLRSGYKLRH